jgi:hypothetical protein
MCQARGAWAASAHEHTGRVAYLYTGGEGALSAHPTCKPTCKPVVADQFSVRHEG